MVDCPGRLVFMHLDPETEHGCRAALDPFPLTVGLAGDLAATSITVALVLSQVPLVYESRALCAGLPQPLASGKTDARSFCVLFSLPQGFEGPTCSHKAPSCGIHHCHHGGLCLPSPKPGSPPLCACLGGFGGPDCLTPPAPQGCGPPSPCLHNGSCSETPRLGNPGFQCSCPPGSPGPRCQRPGANGCEGRGGDGACDAGCSGPGGDWDGGDCSLGVPDPWKGCPSHSQCWLLFRDGRCHPQCDSEECLFDGYDCEIPPTCT